MILHDYKCQICEEVTEMMVDPRKDTSQTICPICNGRADKVFLPVKRDTVDAPWIAKMLEVVDKTSDKPHVKEFLKHPSRANMNAYLKGEGLRHGDRNEPLYPKTDREYKRRVQTNQMLEMHMRRNAVRVGSL